MIMMWYVILFSIFCSTFKMSCPDDIDFVRDIVEKSERFLASEMAKIHHELIELKARQAIDNATIQKLEKDNKILKEKVKVLTSNVERGDGQKKTLQTVEEAFRAALHSVMGASMDITPVLDVLQATDENPCEEETSKPKKLSLKRKLPPSATSV